MGGCRPDRKLVTIRQTKTEGVRVAVLPDFVVDALTPLARGGRVFYPLTKGSVLYAMLAKAEKASGVTTPETDSASISCGTLGRRSCAAMPGWTRRRWSRLALGGPVKAPASMSIWTRLTRP